VIHQLFSISFHSFSKTGVLIFLCLYCVCHILVTIHVDVVLLEFFEKVDLVISRIRIKILFLYIASITFKVIELRRRIAVAYYLMLSLRVHNCHFIDILDWRPIAKYCDIHSAIFSDLSSFSLESRFKIHFLIINYQTTNGNNQLENRQISTSCISNWSSYFFFIPTLQYDSRVDINF